MKDHRSGLNDSGRRRRLRLATAALAAVALCLSTVPSAVADKGGHRIDHRAYPSQDQVDAANGRAARKAGDVGAIKASLLLANQRMEEASLRAEQASEAYNGAMWRLQLAKEKVRQAQAQAVKARRTVDQQRDAIGALVATSYQQGAQLSALSAMMSADGPEGVLDQYAAFQGASTSLQADYDRFAAAESIAQVFERSAEQARAEQATLAAKARVMKDQATAAASQAQAAATQITAEKDQLIRELAKAQNISVKLAQQRQTALEEIARQRAAARAQREAEAAARAQAHADAAAANKARAEARARARAERAKQHDAGQNDPAPAPVPVPSPAPPQGSGGAGQAIAFAKAQLGEPYQWGAAGPDQWDCSGLMMGAWGSAGVYLPHYSAAQYYAGTPISSWDLRPGDLVFWGTSSSPDSIHHVAMYIGGGMIIQAPRTGRPVEIASMYYWIPPNFFVRL